MSGDEVANSFNCKESMVSSRQYMVVSHRYSYSTVRSDARSIPPLHGVGTAGGGVGIATLWKISTSINSGHCIQFNDPVLDSAPMLDSAPILNKT
jgi:glycerate kinase